MPRKSTKNSTENTMSGIDEAINTPVNFQFCEVAEELGIGEAELRERLEDKIGHPGVHQMDTIPSEWESTIKAIKIDLEAEASVRRLEATTEPPIEQQTPVSKVEPPLIEDEPVTQEKNGKLVKKKPKSTGLTNKRKKSIQQQLDTLETVESGIEQDEAVLLVKEAAATGVKIGQAQVIAKESARVNVVREAHKRTVGKLAKKAAAQADYDPLDLVEQAGIEVPEDMREDLTEFSAIAMGKLGAVSQEIQDNNWVNGYTADFTELDGLMQLSDA